MSKDQYNLFGRNRLMKKITFIVLGVAWLAAGSVLAKDAPQANPYNEVLTAVPAAELPAKAADLVSHAKSRDRQEATIQVVKAAVAINPAAAPAIVGAVARAVPDMAAIAASTAAAEQPKLAPAIAKAAAAAAPGKAGKIVAAVCRAVPNQYRDIAVAVAQVVPGSGKDIVNSVGTALPDLRPAIERVLAGYGRSVVSVASTLDQAASVARASASPGTVTPLTAAPATPAAPVTVVGLPAPMARGPTVTPPYWPLTQTPTNVTPGTSGDVPEGGRNYAKP
jgi:hypothetical protein